MPSVGVEDLTTFATAVHEAARTPAAHARTVAVHQVGANLAGHDSHEDATRKRLGEIGKSPRSRAASHRLIRDGRRRRSRRSPVRAGSAWSSSGVRAKPAAKAAPGG